MLSVIFSVASGYIAAVLAKENSRAPMILGIILLLVGIGVQASVWSLLPVWYHLIFLILLVPATIFGGKMRKV